MPYFSESQLEQAFVELFKKEGYDYVYGESISRDTRDVILYDDLRLYLRKNMKPTISPRMKSVGQLPDWKLRTAVACMQRMWKRCDFCKRAFR
ncbi:hypothetical protein ACIXN2_20410 [Bacteroides fragilis]